VNPAAPCVVLLPGSRNDEVRRHLPVVVGAFELIREALTTVCGRMVLPNEALAQVVRAHALPPGLEVQAGGLSEALAKADLAISKSGTITMECASFGVPAVVFYKTSWPTYLIGKQVVSVKYIAMPNLLAGEEIYPEFIQHAATAANIARAGLGLLRDESRRREVKVALARIIQSLGGPGAADRAADVILSLLP